MVISHLVTISHQLWLIDDSNINKFADLCENLIYLTPTKIVELWIAVKILEKSVGK